MSSNNDNGPASKLYVVERIAEYDKEQDVFRDKMYIALGDINVHNAEVKGELKAVGFVGKLMIGLLGSFILGIIMLFVFEPLSKLLGN